MFSQKDINQIHSHNIPMRTVLSQLKRFKSGFPFINLKAPATIGSGIIKLSSTEIEELTYLYEKSILEGVKVSKFVPSSGAASRMFKSLFEARRRLKNGDSEKDVTKDKDISSFLSELKKFAFYEDLKKNHTDLPEQLSLETILDDILLPEKLGYGIYPKGLYHSIVILTEQGIHLKNIVQEVLYMQKMPMVLFLFILQFLIIILIILKKMHKRYTTLSKNH